MGAVHPIDSVIYGERYSDPVMRRLFEERNMQAQRLRFEVVVAQEQAQMGIIPAAAAAEIARGCDVDRVGLERIAQLTAETGNDIVALVRAAGEQMGAEGAEYLHYGLTSQDVHITGRALVLKEAATLLEEGMQGLEAVLVAMAAQYRDTVMIGRTYGQHALPITFGFKLAGWAYVLNQQRRAFAQLKERLLVGSVRGAVGTHAVWGAAGLELEQRVLARLELGCSPISLQPSEERYAEFLNWCALMSTFLGRLCADMRRLQHTEVGEVHEGFEAGKQVSSSTMPHKRNPVWSEAMQGVSYKVRSNAQAMLSVFQEFERDDTRNAAEQLLIAESTILTHKMIVTVRDGLQNLEVDEARMRRNLDLTDGLIAAERLTFELAQRSDAKQTAHAAVNRSAMRAVEEGISFARALEEDEFVSRFMDAEQIRSAIAAAKEEVGTARLQVDRIVKALRGGQEALC
jgi:adenylosuccinate lyase